jgi:hypothetical protein
MDNPGVGVGAEVGAGATGLFFLFSESCINFNAAFKDRRFLFVDVSLFVDISFIGVEGGAEVAEVAEIVGVAGEPSCLLSS